MSEGKDARSASSTTGGGVGGGTTTNTEIPFAARSSMHPSSSSHHCFCTSCALMLSRTRSATGSAQLLSIEVTRRLSFGIGAQVTYPIPVPGSSALMPMPRRPVDARGPAGCVPQRPA